MSRWNQILVGLLALQIAIAAALWLRPEEPGVGPPTALIPDFDASAVERIALFDAPAEGALSDAPAIELVQQGDGWRLASHHDYPADEAKVRDLSSKLAALRTRGPIATSAARQAQFSVSEQDYERRIDLVAGGEPVSLFVGGPAGSRKVAVRLEGSDEIHAVTGFSAAALQAEPGGWILADYFSVDPARVAALSIAGPSGEVVLERDPETDDVWRIVAGAPAGSETQAIDGSKVEPLLDAVATIRASEPADPAADLSPLLATVKIRMVAEEPLEEGVSMAPEEHEIKVARGTGGRYLIKAGEGGRPVFVRELGLLPLVGLDPAELLSE